MRYPLCALYAIDGNQIVLVFIFTYQKIFNIRKIINWENFEANGEDPFLICTPTWKTPGLWKVEGGWKWGGGKTKMTISPLFFTVKWVPIFVLSALSFNNDIETI